MERAKVLQEIRNMRFEELYERQQAGRLSQEQAAEILNVDVRTVRRWMRRYEDDGVDGLIDKRIGQVSPRRAPVDQVLKVQELYRSRYAGFTANIFTRSLGKCIGFPAPTRGPSECCRLPIWWRKRSGAGPIANAASVVRYRA
jgi:transposase